MTNRIRAFSRRLFHARRRHSAEDITYPVRLYGEVTHGEDEKGNWCVPLSLKRWLEC